MTFRDTTRDAWFVDIKVIKIGPDQLVQLVQPEIGLAPGPFHSKNQTAAKPKKKRKIGNKSGKPLKLAVQLNLQVEPDFNFYLIFLIEKSFKKKSKNWVDQSHTTKKSH
jgi:hypothetical protein